jgi:hypothetical protein
MALEHLILVLLFENPSAVELSVVILVGLSWLLPGTHLPEDVSDVGCLLTTVEEGPNLSFCRRCHNIVHHPALYVDGAIGCGNVWGLILVAKIEVSSHC